MQSLKTTLLTLTFLNTPLLVLAGGRPQNFAQLAGNIVDIIDPLVVLTIVLAIVYFLFGVVKYLTQYGNEKARSESVKTITYGLIGLFVMSAMWGLVKLIQSSLTGTGFGIPQF